MSGPVMVMAGGTGGHIFPGLAVAEVLRQRQVEVIWLGSRTGLENQLVPPRGLALEQLSITGLRGKGRLAWLLAPFKLLWAVTQAARVLRRYRPRSVLSMGGFAAAPGGIAAWLLRYPLIVHEQNRIPGMTNRLLARLARSVLSGFPDAFAGSGKWHRVQSEWVGNPVRAMIAALPAPAARFRDRAGPVRLLVLGGSQGARAINRAVPAALAALDPVDRPAVWHQLGRADFDAGQQRYQRAEVEARLVPFIDDMAAAYGWADLVLCRAGALTLAELAAAGVAALLVPYPHAVDDHQTANAAYLVEAGAAVLLAEDQLTAPTLAELLRELGGDRQALQQMGEKARQQSRDNAALRVAEVCLQQAVVAHG